MKILLYAYAVINTISAGVAHVVVLLKDEIPAPMEVRLRAIVRIQRACITYTGYAGSLYTPTK
jgi:hypothetical protein